MYFVVADGTSVTDLNVRTVPRRRSSALLAESTFSGDDGVPEAALTLGPETTQYTYSFYERWQQKPQALTVYWFSTADASSPDDVIVAVSRTHRVEVSWGQLPLAKHTCQGRHCVLGVSPTVGLQPNNVSGETPTNQPTNQRLPCNPHAVLPPSGITYLGALLCQHLCPRDASPSCPVNPRSTWPARH